MNAIFLFLWVFILVGGPVVRLSSSVFVNSILLAGLLTFPYLVFSGYKKFFSNDPLLLALLIWLLVNFLSYLFFGGIDSYGVVLVVYAIISYILFKAFWLRHSINGLIRNVILVSVVNVLLSLVFMLSDSIRNMIDSYVVLNYSEGQESVLNRSNGLFSYGGSVLSVFYVLSLALLWFHSNLFRNYQLIFASISLFLGVFITGRTGFIVLVLWLMVNMYRMIRYGKMVRFALLLGFAFVLLSLIYFNLDVLVNLPTFGQSFARSLEAFIKFQAYGMLETDSGNALIDQYATEIDFEGFWFGTSDYGRSESGVYIPNDSFYFRFFHGAGVLGCVVLVFVYSKLLREIRKDYFMLFLIVLTLILNLKEFFVLGILGYSQIIYLHYFYLKLHFKKLVQK
jgi:hypothetical protein